MFPIQSFSDYFFEHFEAVADLDEDIAFPLVDMLLPSVAFSVH